MKKWRRRIRGALGMGLTWAMAWFGVGIVFLLAIELVGGAGADVPVPILFGLLGFVAGTAFSGVLGVVDGRRRFDQMSMPRFAGWGAVGGLLLSVIFVLALAIAGATILESLALAPVFALAGAGSAAGSLALARMAERRESLDADADMAEVGLSEDESPEMLGRGG